MNRLEKRVCKFLKPYQKKEVLKKVILENKANTDLEKMELITKLDKMSADEIETTFYKVVEDLKRG